MQTDKKFSTTGKTAAILLFAVVSIVLSNWSITGTIADYVSPEAVYAADSQVNKSPYGGVYGEKKEVTTAEEAEKVFKGYFIKKNVKIGEIREKELYFEAEIRDNKDVLIDKVIVDKRTGRIRSIY